MADITTDPAAFGDSNNTLLLKIAMKHWGDLSDAGDLTPPEFGDTDNDLLLKIAQYLELL